MNKLKCYKVTIIIILKGNHLLSLLFFELLKYINDKENVFFGEFQGEKYITHYYIDFLYKDKIIEFQGDIFHANPKIFNENDEPNPFNNMKSKEIWIKDKTKINFLNKNKFKVLEVWENDFLLNKQDVVNNCLLFLKGGDAIC